jgi:hypothetical protein
MKTFKTFILCSSLGLASCQIAWGQNPIKSDLNKQVWIEQNKQTYLNQGGQSEVVPEFTTRSEKIAWFTSNHSLSPNSILPNGDIIDTSPEKARIRTIFPAIPSFPVYIQTGNKSADDAQYGALKEAWIAQHPHQYDQMVPQVPSNPIPQIERLANDLKPQK